MDNPKELQPRTRPTTLKQLLEGEQFRDAVRQALPKHLHPDRFVRVALTALTRTPKLSQCDQASFFQALLTLSQFGLEPDGRRAHLIPFNNRKRNVVECQLIIDYKGLVELALRSGVVSYIHADLICDNDEFEFDRGELKKHRINFKEPRGRAYAVYALCRFKDGTEKAEVMTRDEVESIRSRSRAKDEGPWQTDWNEMAKKTVFRRMSKWLPLSPEFRDAAEADSDEFEEKRFESSKQIGASSSAGIFEALTTGESESEAMLAPAQHTYVPPAEDESAEAAAGLAPAKAPETSENPKWNLSAREHLAKICIEEGYTFDQFKRWASSESLLTEKKKPDDVNSFDEVETVIAQRLVRAKAGMLAGLKQANGGGAA